MFCVKNDTYGDHTNMPNKFNALEICTSGSHVQKWVTNLYNYYPVILLSSIHKLKNFKGCVCHELLTAGDSGKFCASVDWSLTARYTSLKTVTNR